ncbi:MAG: tetratricopeptide repeat protein [Mariprofundaceae bacterium]|nr:tetratricopeptide repeat protein [Mariprofundaceae bacterium]
MFFMLSACVPAHQKALSPSLEKHQKTSVASAKDTAPKPSISEVIQKKSDAFLYLASKAALNDKNYALARSLLEILAKRSDQLLPQLELARLYLNAGKGAQAETLLAPFLKKFPIHKADNEHNSNVVLYGLYVGALLGQHKNDSAVGYLKELLANNPKLTAIRVRLVQVLMTQQSWHEADALIKEGLKQKEQAVLLGLQVESFLHQGHTKKARRTVRRWLELQPNNEKVIILQSDLEREAGNTKKSTRILRNFITTHPAALEVSHHLGQWLIQQKRLAEAARVYEAMLPYGKASVEIYSTLALLYYQQKQHRKAADALIEGLRLAPNNAMFHFYLGVNQEILGELDAAVRHYKHVTKQHNRYAMSQLRLAVIAMNRNALDRAISILEPLLEEKPEFSDGWAVLSSLYLQQKAYQKLLDATRPALALASIPDGLLLNRAVALDHFKRFDEIDSTIQQLLVQSPDNAEALNFLGYSLAERGVRLDEAEKYLRRALKEKPNNGFYLDSLAWIFYQRGIYPKAITLQRKALKFVDTIDPIMLDHLGDMLWRNGEQADAILTWKDALSREKGDKQKDLEKKIRQGL